MPSVHSPIIVLDSGLGGLTVARALRRVLPHEDLLYFGDTARVPYGSKTAATVIGFVRQIINYLRPHDPKHVVIACNTATALALQSIRREFSDLSISGVIEPGAKAAVEAAGDKRFPLVGIIATEATIRSRAYEHAIARRRQHARLVCRPTPLIVPLIEEGRGAEDPIVRLALRQYLLPLAQRSLDVLVLGCTHYPVYKDLIQEIVGKRVTVIDSADKCAEDVHRRLRSAGMLRDADPEADEINQALGLSDIGTGYMRCFVTDDSPRFGALASQFLGFEVSPPAWVSPDDMYNPAGDVASVGLRPAI